MSVPNQKIVKVKKEVCDKQHLYTMCNLDAMQAAMKDLSGDAFKLWCYLSSNQNGYTFELSQKAVSEKTGMSKASYYRQVKEITDKGYLVLDCGNSYIFSEKPQSQNETIKSQNETKLSQNEQRNITNNTLNNTQAKLKEPEGSFNLALGYSNSKEEFEF